MTELITLNTTWIKFASKRLLLDPIFIKKSLEIDPYIFPYIPFIYKEIKEFVLLASKTDFLALHHAHQKLKDD